MTDSRPPLVSSLGQLRRQFPHTANHVFFDHANVGPPPAKALRLLQNLGERYQRIDQTIDADCFKLLGKLRAAFGRLIHAPEQTISYLPNTSHAINQVLLGLNLQQGERIVVPEVEFPALTYPIMHLRREQGVVVDFVPCENGFLDLDGFERRLKSHKTALVATSWVQYHNGYRYDPVHLTDICHRHGAFLLVDATQGVGPIPLDVVSAGVDALACGGAKWLFCGPGSGFLYVSKSPVRAVNPASIGWLSVDWGYSFGDLQRFDRPLYADGRRFEWGTYPYYQLQLVRAGLEVIEAAGPERTFRHVTTLLDQLGDWLTDHGFTVTSPCEEPHRSAILTFTGRKIADLHQTLNDQRFYVSLREGSIRVSPHCYNTKTEMHRFIAAIEKTVSRPE